MNFPQYTLASHWQYQPLLLRHGDRRYFVLFSQALAALPFTELYSLQSPQGLTQIDSAEELLAWAAAAEAAGAQAAWLDPVLDCQAISPVTQLPLAELIAQASSGS
jgi:putative N-acetylmannosamine-6-phosphate epimerase